MGLDREFTWKVRFVGWLEPHHLCIETTVCAYRCRDGNGFTPWSSLFATSGKFTTVDYHCAAYFLTLGRVYEYVYRTAIISFSRRTSSSAATKTGMSLV